MMFSVIVPTYNRVDSLRRTVESILRQTLTDFELIVVNDGSTDSTATFLSNTKPNHNIIIVNQENHGPAAARNAGVKRSTGTFVLCTDDDCVVPPEWLSLVAETIKQTDADIIGGRVKNGVQGNLFSDVSQEITNYLVEYSAQYLPPTTFLTSNNIAYKREAFLMAGGFDERFRNAGGEERALHVRILHKGGKSIFASDIIVEHYHILTLKKFIRQQYNYGRGSYLLYRVIGKELSVAPRRIPFSVYLRLMFSFFSPGIFLGSIKLILCVLAQGTILLGFLRQAIALEHKPPNGVTV
jgi:glycosyltransferase involved in cell wall biosynthesis